MFFELTQKTVCIHPERHFPFNLPRMCGVHAGTPHPSRMNEGRTGRIDTSSLPLRLRGEGTEG